MAMLELVRGPPTALVRRRSASLGIADQIRVGLLPVKRRWARRRILCAIMGRRSSPWCFARRGEYFILVGNHDFLLFHLSVFVCFVIALSASSVYVHVSFVVHPMHPHTCQDTPYLTISFLDTTQRFLTLFDNLTHGKRLSGSSWRQ